MTPEARQDWLEAVTLFVCESCGYLCRNECPRCGYIRIRSRWGAWRGIYAAKGTGR